MNSTQFTYDTPKVVTATLCPGIAQPSNVIDVDEMTMDQLLVNSCKPRNSHRLTNRRLNIALNPEAMQDLVEEIAQTNALKINELPYLVYSNGLLLTPEGEVATLEEYNLSTAEIDRQLLLQLNQTGMEEPDECIISLTTVATSAYTTPTKKTDTPLEMPILRRHNNNENVRKHLQSILGIEPMRLFE
jgi:hypothetical protein